MAHHGSADRVDPAAANLGVALVPRRVLVALASIATTLVGLHVAGLVFVFAFGLSRRAGWSGSWQRTFNLNLEGNVPTFFAASLLLLCALLLAWLARAAPSRPESGSAGARRAESWRWGGLAAVFTFLALDEATQLHERLSRPLRTTFALPDALHFAWLLPYGAALLVLALVYARFLLRLPSRPRALLFLAALLYGSALPLEMFGGAETAAGGNRSLRYALISTGEEVLELAGVVVFAYGLLLLLAARRATLVVASGRAADE